LSFRTGRGSDGNPYVLVVAAAVIARRDRAEQRSALRCERIARIIRSMRIGRL
jgi:hypothetical protein